MFANDMIDHITINVQDLEKSKAFYEQVLAPLGMRVNFGSIDEGFWGFGSIDASETEIAAGRFFVSQTDESHPASRSVHIAFRCEARAEVIAFYDAAMRAGGQDNGAPGLRPEYGEKYFAAFVHDPDGNNIEAVTFASE